jgi:TolB-like protein/Tfp pilus assembly protein PilF
VLPFKNLSSDTEQEYFAEGMTEELITALARIDSVRLISRTSVMRYKNTKKSVPEITRELNVDAVVEGAVLRSGSRVRLSVQLVAPFPERHLWADVYEGDIRNVVDLQREAARDLGGKIGAKVAARPALDSARDERLDPETYENYLRARHFLARRDAEAMQKALGYFQNVLQRNPEYAPAYAGLALAYDVLGSYELLPPQKSFPNAKSFASRALQLDNTLAEAYTARAAAASYWEFNWSAAEHDFQRAIALDPSSELGHHWYAEHLINIGRADRVVAEMKRARDLDPLSLVVNTALGRVYSDAHRYLLALEQCRKALDLDPNIAMGHWCFGQVYIAQHRYGAAIQELELANTLGTTPLILRNLAWAYAAVGNKAKATAILASLTRQSQSQYMSSYSIRVVHAALGEKDEAFQYLERAFAERDGQITYLALDPELDPLRSDPRFQALIERLHIPR